MGRAPLTRKSLRTLWVRGGILWRWGPNRMGLAALGKNRKYSLITIQICEARTGGLSRSAGAKN